MQANKSVLFFFKGDIREITGEVYSSSGKRIPCNIVPIDDEKISIHFVPQERGIHTVKILNRGVHIPGASILFAYLAKKQGIYRVFVKVMLHLHYRFITIVSFHLSNYLKFLKNRSTGALV